MLPAQITFRDLPASLALETYIRKRIDKLSQYYHRVITSCRVVIDVPQKHQHQGKIFNARIDVTVPGRELAITKQQNEDVYLAIRDAFDALERQLESLSRKKQGAVKVHMDVLHGHVVRMVADEGYGFIEDQFDNEYYFGMTNVHYPSFEQLSVGDAVSFSAAPFNSGLQAHHVTKKNSPLRLH